AALSGIIVAHAADDASTAFQKAYERLTESCRQIERLLADYRDAKARLVQAQRASTASSGDDGGSAASMIVALCRTTMTSARSSQLEAYLNCEEGDLACPVRGE